MKQHLNNYLLPLAVLDIGTMLVLSFYIYYGKRIFFPFIFLSVINYIITSIILFSHKKTIYVHHLLGKSKIDFLSDYMKMQTLIMTLNTVLFTSVLFVTQVTVGKQIFIFTECCLILLLTNSLVYFIFLRSYL